VEEEVVVAGDQKYRPDALRPHHSLSRAQNSQLAAAQPASLDRKNEHTR
jgi:hypothetical protein